MVLSPQTREDGEEYIHRVDKGVDGRGLDFNSFQHLISMDSIERIQEPGWKRRLGLTRAQGRDPQHWKSSSCHSGAEVSNHPVPQQTR